MHLRIRNPQERTNHGAASKAPQTQVGTTYLFSTLTAVWEPVQSLVSSPTPSKLQIPNTLTISSYNVLRDGPIHPPTRERYPLLLSTLFSPSALSDILVLQEVSDEFLSYFLAHPKICTHYLYTTRPPPDQAGIKPLPSLRNIVVLSRWEFSWEWLPFDNRYKRAVILQFEHIREQARDNEPWRRLVVTGVQITCGLTDGAVATKKSQLQTLISHLSTNYGANPWIVAGGFYLTISKFVVEDAVKSSSISRQTVSMIKNLETMMCDAGMVDAWVVAGAGADAGGMERRTIKIGSLKMGKLNEGEEGA
jgi:hypothetical protein